MLHRNPFEDLTVYFYLCFSFQQHPFSCRCFLSFSRICFHLPITIVLTKPAGDSGLVLLTILIIYIFPLKKNFFFREMDVCVVQMFKAYTRSTHLAGGWDQGKSVWRRKRRHKIVFQHPSFPQPRESFGTESALHSLFFFLCTSWTLTPGSSTIPKTHYPCPYPYPWRRHPHRALGHSFVCSLRQKPHRPLFLSLLGFTFLSLESNASACRYQFLLGRWMYALCNTYMWLSLLAGN